jgi:hypothetical protein
MKTEETKQVCKNCKIEISKYGCACGTQIKEEPKQELPQFGTKEFNTFFSDLCDKNLGGNSKNKIKHTAVEWLEDCFNRYGAVLKSDFIKSKEMEKQQIIDADLNGSVRTAKAIDYRITQLRIKELAEQYYNETFKNK